jgi:cell division protein FtsB
MNIDIGNISHHSEVKSSVWNSFFKKIFIVLSIIIAVVFILQMLFGQNSIEVYQALKEDKRILNKKIYHLKQENAALQKKYFEYKSLLPEREYEK